MNILDTIIAEKKKEVAKRQKEITIASLEQHPLFGAKTFSLKKSLLSGNNTGIIAEFKRKSPSKGIINANAKVQEVTGAYAQHGAAGISVLTDQNFFGGALADLEAATINNVPLLRKDFIIDAYQLVEAKAYGASVILLIAACLTPTEVQELAKKAHDLGLEVLLELHEESELAHVCDEIDIVGINNRNLKTFEVSVATSLSLIQKLPEEIPAISESGITNVETIVSLKRAGFSGFLIGENFMKQPHPAIAFAEFVYQLKAYNEN